MPNAATQHDTAHAIKFLQRFGRPPTLSASHVDKTTGKKGLFETKTFPEPVKWDDVYAWIETRQGKANLYYALNPLIPAKAADNKAGRGDVLAMSALHADIDARVGETGPECVARMLDAVKKYPRRPSIAIASGGGVQFIWLLKEPVPINGEEERYEDAKLWNIHLERDFGGDHTHNVDRILRLPGTWNCPHDKKRDKGREYVVATTLWADWDVRYDIADFPKATAVQDTGPKTSVTSSPAGIDVKISGNRNSVDPNDERLQATAPKWRLMAFKGDTEKQFGGDRSRAAFAMVCQFVRDGIPDDLIADMMMDPDYVGFECVREKKNKDRELKRYLSRAHEMAIDPDLAEMNSEHFVTSVNGKTRVVTYVESEVYPGRYEMTFSTFDDFANLHSNRMKVIGKEPDLDYVPLGKWWLMHKNRRQYNGGMRFMPHRDAEVVGKRLNLWKGFAVAPRAGDCQLYLDHIRENICGGDSKSYDYLIRWMAHAVQHRDGPGHVAVCLRGKQGAGKGFFIKTFGALFGEHFTHVTNPDHLTGKFNAHLETTYVLFGDECFYAGDRRHEQILKVMVTEETIVVEPKGVNAYAARNFLHLMLATNADWIVPVAADDRRWFVLDVGEAKRRDEDYFQAIADQMKAGGYEALLHMLLNMDLSAFRIRQFPETAAYARQKKFTRRGVDALVEHLAQDGVLPHPVYANDPAVAITTGTKRGEGFWSWARDTFPDLRFRSPESIAMELKEKWNVTKWHQGRLGLRGVRFPPLADLRAAFDARHGAQSWGVDAPNEWVAPVEPDTAHTGRSARPGDDRGMDDIPF